VRRRTQRLPGPIRVLVGTSFVVAVGYGIVSPALPLFAAGFDVGVTAVSGVISAFAVFRIAFAPVGGRLVGRLGELRVFRAGLAIVVADTAGFGAAFALAAVIAAASFGYWLGAPETAPRRFPAPG
jgi:MFS family permease